MATPFTSALARVTGTSGGGRAHAAVFGAPLDATASFRPGAAGGPSAVRELSESLETYSPELGCDLEDIEIVDLGDLGLEGLPMEEALAAVTAAMQEAASAARLAVMIGGEHTVSLAGYRAIKRRHPEALLLHVDAHLDIRPEYGGEAVTHASWLYHAGEEHGFGDILQVGVRSGAREEWQLAHELCAWCRTDWSLPPDGSCGLGDRPVYLSIDIDVLDPAVAPGTGCPEPGGPGFIDLIGFLRNLSETRLVAADVVEVAPALDSSGITAVAGAKILREVLLQAGRYAEKRARRSRVPASAPAGVSRGAAT